MTCFLADGAIYRSGDDLFGSDGKAGTYLTAEDQYLVRRIEAAVERANGAER